ncbi:hemolysin III family protein [Rhodoluna sp.]|uniref:PAQR family membrane homeostasis protein TrhA n=1 Tax=Rhodoluna sp. TaxID=1969481 RepID=UPI0025EDB374|nr:hemolysin III family protein [Rhodoluna sp.]
MSDWRKDEGLPGYLPVSEGYATAPDEKKPSWRGWIHTGVLPLVIAGGIVLIVLANGTPAKISSAIFFATSILLFGNSALYHRFNWKPKVKVALKRIDHANIFLLIAGSYTPITWLALPKEKALMLMIIIWGTALLGIGFRIFWISAPRWLYVPIYVGMGWAAIAYVVDFMNANAPMMILILAGGLCYTLGAVVYGLKKPNPIPGHFGFHEIFHTFTVLAFMSHWAGVLLIALSPAAGSFGL